MYVHVLNVIYRSKCYGCRRHQRCMKYVYLLCSTGLMKANPPKGTRWHPKSIPRNTVVVQGQHRVRRWHPGTQAFREIRHYQRMD